MLEKLVRAIVTIIGAIVGYGFYLLIKYLAGLKGYDLETIFSVAEKMFIVTAIALIFAIIFYKLFPVFRRGGMKAAGNLESDLKDTSVNDIISTVAGLIIGLFVAYLISRGIYTSIEMPVVNIILNITGNPGCEQQGQGNRRAGSKQKRFLPVIQRWPAQR